jgi:hypothetical protein
LPREGATQTFADSLDAQRATEMQRTLSLTGAETLRVAAGLCPLDQ